MIRRALIGFVGLLLVVFLVLDAPANLIMVGSAGGSTAGGGGDPPAASSACEGQVNQHYVRPAGGMYGTEDGSDWDNAFDGIPAALTRSHSYYLADGSYGSYSANDATSGTDVINLCKATVADHGTDTGWVDTLGDGTATFSSIPITTSYWTIDGSSGGGPGSWTSGHGIELTAAASGGSGSFISFTTGLTNITISHVYFHETGDTEDDADLFNAMESTGGEATVSNSLFEYNYIDNIAGLPFFMRGGSGNIFQYNYTGNVCGASEFDVNSHCEVVVIHDMDNVHFRWNWVGEAPSSGGFVKNDVETSDLVRIYGNFFGNGFPINCNTGTCTNWRVFNNTFHHADGGPVSGDGTDTDSMFYNNISFSFTEMSGMWGDDHDYNWFSQCAGLRCTMGAETHENICVGCSGGCDSVTTNTDVFVDSSGDTPEELSLTGAIAGQSGTDVCALDDCTGEDRFDEDMFGTVRGADGTWERGAVEFDAS